MDSLTQSLKSDKTSLTTTTTTSATTTPGSNVSGLLTAHRSHVAPPRFFEEDPVIWLVQLDLFFRQAGVEDQLSRFRIAATLLPGHHTIYCGTMERLGS